MTNKNEIKKVDPPVEKIDTPTMTAVKNFFRNKLAVTGLVTFITIFLVVFIGSSLTEFNPYYSQPVLKDLRPGSGFLEFPSELKDQKIKEIESGISFSVALTEDGKIYTWGQDNDKSLSIPQNIKEQLDTQFIKDIAVGDRHVVLLTQNNEILGWGNNSFGQTSLEALFKEGKSEYISCPPSGCPEELVKDSPGMIIETEGIKKIEASDQTTGVLTNRGSLVVWGAVMNNKFDKVPEDIQGHVKDFKMSSNAIIVLLDDGTVDVFGVVGSLQKRYLPAELTDGSIKLVDIGISYENAFAVDDQGNLYAWGATKNAINNLPELTQKVVKIDIGRTHGVLQYEDGTLVNWGSNNYNETSMPTDLKDVDYFSTDFFQNYAVSKDGNIKAWGNNGFLLGSDEYGRDLFTRLLHGGRVSLTVGAIAVVISVIIGVIIGMISGFKGGRIDNLLMRVAEIVGSFPFYPLIITLSAMLPPESKPNEKLVMIMVILGLTGWTGIARLVRGQILQEREKDFVLAARALGIKEKNIITRHILPNVLNIIIVQVTLGYASSLLSEAGLSFLGFGVPYPYPSWGNMLSDAQTPTVIENLWWRWVFPGFMVFLTALSINIIGDGLRDALDPKSNEK